MTKPNPHDFHKLAAGNKMDADIDRNCEIDKASSHSD